MLIWQPLISHTSQLHFESQQCNDLFLILNKNKRLPFWDSLFYYLKTANYSASSSSAFFLGSAFLGLASALAAFSSAVILSFNA